jgi:drug/metabolite transporter (DMT)-like permease
MNPGLSSKTTRAISMIVLAALLFAVMDSAAKYISFLSAILVMWSRYAIQACIMTACILSTRGARGLRADHPRFQVLRGVLLVTTSTLSFLGIREMPLAEFTAIIMLSPLLVTAATHLLRYESVSPLRWAFVFGGFLGTLMVIRPGSGLFGAAVVLPLAAMMTLAAYNLLTSRLAAMDHPHTSQFYTGVTATVALTPLLLMQAETLPAVLQALAPLHIAILLLIGLLGTTGHLLVVTAFGSAGAATLMPFIYSQIGFAAIMSWLVFHHAPDTWAWIGMFMIAACGAASAWARTREGNHARP